MRLLTLTLLLGTLGCGRIQTEYGWIQEEDGLAMKAPIVFTVRTEWTADTLYVRQKATDVNGKVFIDDSKWYNREGMACSYFDADNWDCKLLGIPDGETLEHIRMDEGELKWFYWTNERPIKRKYRIFGFRLP